MYLIFFFITLSINWIIFSKMYSNSINKFEKPKSALFNKRNSISIEWPEYLSSNPNYIVMDNQRRYYSKGEIKNVIKNQSNLLNKVL